MSETDTRDLVTRTISAFNAGDHDALLTFLADDVACDLPGADRVIGRDDVRWRLAAASRHFRVHAADIAVMTAPGGVRAAAEFTLRGTYLATVEGLPEARGQNFRIPAGAFLDVDDESHISRLTFCCDLAALRAELETAGRA